MFSPHIDRKTIVDIFANLLKNTEVSHGQKFSVYLLSTE